MYKEDGHRKCIRGASSRGSPRSSRARRARSLHLMLREKAALREFEKCWKLAASFLYIIKYILYNVLGPRPETLEIFSLVLPPLPRAGATSGPWRRRKRLSPPEQIEARSKDESGIVVRDLHGVDPMVLPRASL